MASLLFVHSPLVGPSSLRPLAELAEDGGRAVALPDLTGTVSANRPHEAYAGSAIEAARDLEPPVVVVGHSGAGPFLPTIGAAIASGTTLVFVDAVLPPAEGSHRTPARLGRMLDKQSVAGTLRRWLDWWPPEVLDEILPEAATREMLASDMPDVPRAFYDSEVAVPPRWSAQPCGYVRLSSAYDGDCAEAIARGWPVEELESTHLAVFTAPSGVLEAVNRVVRRIGRSRTSTTDARDDPWGPDHSP